jgi:hypothetical protein
MDKLGLSKSKIVLGLQCEKALYLTVHQPGLAKEVSDSQQMIFDQGKEVGVYAQQLFPDGISVDAPYYDAKLAIAQTKAAISADALHIYEATFEYDGVLVKVDILTRTSKKSPWEIVEVKSSTQAKDVHLQDVAVQVWVLRSAGLKVKSASILHINNQCFFPKLSNLFTRVDVTEDVEALQNDIPKAVLKFQKLLRSKSEPMTDIGPHCDDPYECGFKELCWSKKNVPEISTFDIPRLSTKKKWELYSDGTIALDSVDASEFNDLQRRMIEVTLSKKRFVNRTAIKKELSKWEYPLSFLDFETIAFAIPRYDGVRPYQQLPFQFSCHMQKNERQNLDHYEYLHTENSDPREAIARSLVEMLPSEGSVVAYNMGFEKQVLLALSDQFPKMKKSLKSMAERLVDPLTIFRSHVYDPNFNGSFSIKDVAPAILGKKASYEGLSVGDGSEAQNAFLKLISPDTSAAVKAQLKAGLIAYCQKDTLGMVELVWWLQQEAEKQNGE